MTEINVKTQIKSVQEEQDQLMRDLRFVEEQQQDFFRLNQQEQRLYNELAETGDLKERHFFRRRGEENLTLAKKAQSQLEKQEDELRKHRQQLIEKEELLYREQRKKGE